MVYFLKYLTLQFEKEHLNAPLVLFPVSHDGIIYEGGDSMQLSGPLKD